MKGLVLEGGAMRGMYTAGALDVLMENKITFDKIVGVSAGAVFGCNYKSNQIGRTIRYNKKYINNPEYMSLKSLIKTGNLFGTEFCYKDIPEKLDPFDIEAFKKNPAEFYVVTTDIKTGKPLYHRCDVGNGKDLLWMRASASMPLVSEIVKADGYEMLDGGISDSIPVKWMLDKGTDKTVVVLTQPDSYKKEKNSALSFIKLKYRKYPALIKTMSERHIVYNETVEYIKELEKQGKIFVIRPKEKLIISRLEKNPENLQKVYDLGREDMEDNLEKLNNYLN